MSPIRTSTPRTSNKIKFAVAGAALALVATVGGTVSVLSAGGPAESAASGAPPISASHALSVRALYGSEYSAEASRPPSVVLDAYSARRRRPLTPKQIARQMLGTFHWARWQFNYLNLLWSRESSWNVFASNPYSGAYGIPQAVPGSKMSSAGPRWWNSARTQIRWGMRYIKSRYGSPKAAWEHEQATGWY